MRDVEMTIDRATAIIIIGSLVIYLVRFLIEGDDDDI